MPRITTQDLLVSLREELFTHHGIDATIRYTRVGDQVELTRETKYYIEPGMFQTTRVNVGTRRSCRRFDSCRKKPRPAILESRIVATVETFERVARDVMKTPGFVPGAFLQGVATFEDAQGCYSVEAAEESCNVFGGVALTFVIE